MERMDSERDIVSQTHLTLFMEFSLIQSYASFVYFNRALELYFGGPALMVGVVNLFYCKVVVKRLAVETLRCY